MASSSTRWLPEIVTRSIRVPAGGASPSAEARGAGNASPTTARPISSARTRWPLVNCKTRETYQTGATQ